MTEISETLACLQRIEIILTSIDSLLRDVFEKPKIERESVGFNEIRERLRRARYRQEVVNARR